MRLFGYFLAFLLSAGSFVSQAAPWIKADDRYLRSSLKILADGGYLRTSINTYPLMWQPVLNDLANISTATLNDSQLFAYLRVLSAANFAKQSGIKTLSIAASSDDIGSEGFGQSFHYGGEVNIASELKGQNWAVGISKTFATDDHYANQFSTNSSWQGSYAAYTAGNWVLSVAQQQLWWGPGYASSLSFNHSGKPVKALQFSRLNSTLPLFAALEPLGSVNIQLLLAEQPGTALLRHASVVGARINIKPMHRFEFAVSASQLHTVNSVVPVTDALNSNISYRLPDSRITSVSIDSRYSISTNLAAYAELIHNNAALGWLAGTEYLIANSTVQALLVAEYSEMADDLQQWQSLQHDSPLGQAANRWLLGLELHYRNGSSFYTNLRQQSFSQYTALVADIPLNKQTKLAAGYQTALFHGLLTIDGELSRDAWRTGTVNFSQSIGMRWERRW